MQKFGTLRQPFWDYSNGVENNNKRKNLPKIVAYLGLLRWSHVLCYDQKAMIIICVVKGIKKGLGANISPEMTMIFGGNYQFIILQNEIMQTKTNEKE